MHLQVAVEVVIQAVVCLTCYSRDNEACKTPRSFASGVSKLILSRVAIVQSIEQRCRYSAIIGTNDQKNLLFVSCTRHYQTAIGTKELLQVVVAHPSSTEQRLQQTVTVIQAFNLPPEVAPRPTTPGSIRPHRKC